MQIFPTVASSGAFRTWRSDRANWLPVAKAIANHHGLAVVNPFSFATGTNLVIALDDALILKVFPPIYRSQFVSERATLRQLRGKLDLPIPEIVAEGGADDWSYLVITRLAGILGSQAWRGLPEEQKERVLQQIGETIAQVHSVPLGELTRIEPRWPEFIERQIAGCRERHVRLGLPKKYLADLDALLENAATLIPMDAPPVILTGEYIPENFLLGKTNGRWGLAGLIDFGDVMTGWREYDLLGPSAFMAAGRPGRVCSLLRGFGYGDAVDPIVRRRLLTLIFLHRASDPMRHICIEGWEHRINRLTDLEDLIWPTGD
ncbi:aminoglycoside phosphotransferase family protein [Bosea sp. PAMC 26642]|uniref:aminoglycoside phosphotransferase family protein n=1 Tax=Bosea sp. (strain PAMC 26642) TaxID=1792307 RepID=UPI0007701E71|nr:aminoglycoside 3'-phosphotransferase/choline kinase family protein [Bosea sp. PAMC 26642]AMJ61367.1 phosphotransferase [Bosea sp. PAMC 26642]